MNSLDILTQLNTIAAFLSKYAPNTNTITYAHAENNCILQAHKTLEKIKAALDNAQEDVWTALEGKLPIYVSNGIDPNGEFCTFKSDLVSVVVNRKAGKVTIIVMPNCGGEMIYEIPTNEQKRFFTFDQIVRDWDIPFFVVASMYSDALTFWENSPY